MWSVVSFLKVNYDVVFASRSRRPILRCSRREGGSGVVISQSSFFAPVNAERLGDLFELRTRHVERVRVAVMSL